MCLTPIYLPSTRYEDTSGMSLTYYRKVPCGHCIECLEKKQTELAVLSLEESKKYNTMHFFTLTYSPEKVPISHTREYISTESGDVIGYSMRSFDKKYHLDKTQVEFIPKKDDKTIREMIYSNQSKSKHNYVTTNSLPGRTDVIALDTYTFSLRREDIKNWIKRCRRKWEYNHPEKPLKFSYYGAGEYGSQTWRPHYHFQFFGLTDEQASFFSNEWKNGYVDCKSVSKLSSDDVLKVSQYTAKYISKIPLSFQDNEEHISAIENKNIEKSRRQGSLNYGISPNFDKIKVDILQGADVNIYDTEKAKEIIQNKAVYHYAGNTYPIPGKIKDRIFKEQGPKGLLNTPLRKAISDIVEARQSSIYFRQLRQVMSSPEHQGCSIQDASEILIEKEKEDRRIKYNTKKDNILRKYMKSKIK